MHTNEFDGSWKVHGQILRSMVSDWNLLVLDVRRVFKVIWQIGCDIQNVFDVVALQRF